MPGKKKGLTPIPITKGGLNPQILELHHNVMTLSNSKEFEVLNRQILKRKRTNRQIEGQTARGTGVISASRHIRIPLQIFKLSFIGFSWTKKYESYNKRVLL
jgi:hypothetical protein